VSWNAPFLSSASGYGSEATSFLVGLNATLNPKWRIAAGLAHGDAIDRDYVANLPPDLLELFQAADQAQRQMMMNNNDKAIVICHSEPGAWSVPSPLYDSGWPCPPSSEQQHSHTVVGRTMFETDRLPTGWNHRLNEMDEIWVPTRHEQRIFLEAGVTKPIQVVGQGIDIHYWNPDRVEPLDFKTVIDPEGKCSEDDTKFLSVFKWESRKGPDVLVPSFWKAFPGGKGACLIIVTSLYHQDADRVFQDINTYWAAATMAKEATKADEIAENPSGIVLLSGLPLQDLVRLYKSVDVFVLPSRGEGWGRPYMEAMAMGLPVIATNWSGPTEFLDNDHGYLLPIRGLVDANLEAFPNHKWADPDPKELERLLKHVVNHPAEAKQKGKRARQVVVDRWSNMAVAKVVARHLERLANTREAKVPPIKGEDAFDHDETITSVASSVESEL
jgi:glycosyltransferase involved in cell wall biosynthesis